MILASCRSACPPKLQRRWASAWRTILGTGVSYGKVPAGSWTQVEVDMANLSPDGLSAHRINIMTNDRAAWTYYIDEWGLLDIRQAMVAVDWDAEDATFSWDASGNMKTNTGGG